MPRIRLVCLLSALIVVGTSASAKPPSLAHLFPAGAQRGQSVAVTATGTFDHWPVLVWTSGTGVTVTSEKDKGKLTIKVAPDAKPGVHWIRLYDEEGATELKPFLVGLLPELVEAEPSSVEIPPKITINGRLAKRAEVDQYSVRLLKGQTLLATVVANQTLMSPMDSVLQVASSEGFVLAQNDDDHGMDPLIAFKAPEEGTYLVRLFAFPAVPNSTIGFAGDPAYIYRLTLTTGGYVDFPYPLMATRGGTGSVEVLGWNVPDAAARISVTPEKDEDVATLIHPDLANAVEVRLVPHPSEVEHEPNDAAHPQPIVIPSTISGRVDQSKDRDVFEFSAKKGQSLTFRLEARSLDSPLDAVLTVTDSAGKTLVEADDVRRNRDPELNFTSPADGSYRLVVRDLSEQGGDRFVYGIEATLSEPDFRLSLAADRFTLEPGKPLSLPVTVLRRNGFNQAIEVRLEGFPAGVEATSVRSEPDGESARSVKLTLTSKGTPGSVPIQVVGKAASGPKLERFAQLPGSDRTSMPAWLTVLKPGVVAPAMETNKNRKK